MGLGFRVPGRDICLVQSVSALWREHKAGGCMEVTCKSQEPSEIMVSARNQTSKTKHVRSGLEAPSCAAVTSEQAQLHC